MKPVEIIGTAKIEATIGNNGTYGNVKINEMDLDILLSQNLIEKKEGDWPHEIALCRVVINIEPYAESLVINGQEATFEL